ncbi:hypothetical protein AMTR_s00064p00026420 [Amborella trichopoda]|uniref:Uncharacterized protein n=1 Tax=Amborella trichopoda TaxID=13333 RepID=U5DBZ8_AMBTC|nr:hypothetical protein AMTR_s00064p00026420 [Amborella trichopoda]
MLAGWVGDGCVRWQRWQRTGAEIRVKWKTGERKEEWVRDDREAEVAAGGSCRKKRVRWRLLVAGG